MAELKLLTDRLMENKRVEIQKEIETAKKEATDNVADAEAAISEEEKIKQAQIDAQLKRQYEQDKNALSIKRRNSLLAEKQKALSTVFEQVNKNMENWNEDQFKNFLLTVLSQFESNESITLALGENSKNNVTTEWLETKTKDKIPVRLSQETVPKKNGFLIRHKGIDYNYFFEDMIEDSKEDLVAEVSQKLFQ
ncbi:MAG: ATPase [Pisciglobus halotolerans]|nr:ATPase [Pisciglobus halotolerans]